MEIWDLTNAKSLYRRKASSDIRGVVILDERRVGLANGSDGPAWRLEIWDLAANKILDSRPMGQGTPLFGAAAQNGEWILVPFDGGAVRLENQDKGGQVVPINKGSRVNYASFSQDGSLFALGFLFGRGTVFDTSTLIEKASLAANLRSFQSACFSPDNKRLITTGEKLSGIHFWDIEFGQPLISLEVGRDSAQFALMSPNGNLLLSANQEQLHIFRAPTWDDIAAIDGVDAD
jgi:WD40 repeat protein